MDQFKAATAALNLKQGDAMFTQAAQLWEMLDDMAKTNPTKYRQFIDKQRADRDRLVAETAITAVFAVYTTDVRPC